MIWAIKVLTGDYDSPYKDRQPSVVIGVKQSSGTVHEGILCQINSDITKDLLPILHTQLDTYNKRIIEIESLIESIDKLLENK